MEGLTLQDYSEHCKLNETIVKEMLELAKNYNKVTRKLLVNYLAIAIYNERQHVWFTNQKYNQTTG